MNSMRVIIVMNEEFILSEEIEFIRQEMIKTGLKYGFSHPRTVQMSQLLDQLLNEYDKMRNKKIDDT